MNDPISKLFPSFSKWVKQRNTNFTKDKESSQKELKRDWYKPDGPDITVRDINKIKELFDREDIQETFKRWLKEEGIVLDATIMRFQNGFIAADERAFRVRHQTIPRAIAHGQLVHNTWVHDGLKKLFFEYIETLLQLAQKDKKVRMKS